MHDPIDLLEAIMKKFEQFDKNIVNRIVYAVSGGGEDDVSMTSGNGVKTINIEDMNPLEKLFTAVHRTVYECQVCHNQQFIEDSCKLGLHLDMSSHSDTSHHLTIESAALLTIDASISKYFGTDPLQLSQKFCHKCIDLRDTRTVHDWIVFPEIIVVQIADVDYSSKTSKAKKAKVVKVGHLSYKDVPKIIKVCEKEYDLYSVILHQVSQLLFCKKSKCRHSALTY